MISSGFEGVSEGVRALLFIEEVMRLPMLLEGGKICFPAYLSVGIEAK